MDVSSSWSGPAGPTIAFYFGLALGASAGLRFCASLHELIDPADNLEMHLMI
jgi:hypothetical protein